MSSSPAKRVTSQMHQISSQRSWRKRKEVSLSHHARIPSVHTSQMKVQAAKSGIRHVKYITAASMFLYSQVKSLMVQSNRIPTQCIKARPQPLCLFLRISDAPGCSSSSLVTLTLISLSSTSMASFSRSIMSAVLKELLFNFHH